MKIVILGGGPGGYVTAIRAAQLGAKVTLIESENIGGTCLNAGCIPTKVLLHSTEIFDLLNKEAVDFGLLLGDVKVDWSKLQERKDLVVTQLVEGVKVLLETNKIEVIYGKGTFISKNTIEVDFKDKGKKEISFDKAIIATGSKPTIIPIPGRDIEGVITSTEAMSLESIPESISIIGGGVIGVEFANIYSNLGSKVTLIEMLPSLVSNMDEEIVQYLEDSLMSKGVNIYKQAKVKQIEKDGYKLKVLFEENTNAMEISSEKVLMATGRRPNTELIGLEQIGIKVEKGAVVVDRLFKTNIDNIYAIGDCTGGVQLAHVASASGMMVAEIIMGKISSIDFRTIPYCVYTKPELASVGLTEEAAIKSGYKVRIGKFPLYANGKSVIMGEVAGLVKFVVNATNEEILGLHIAGHGATELIGIGALAIRLEVTMEEIMTTIHAHPTVGEAIHEAAEDVFGRAIHLPAV